MYLAALNAHFAVGAKLLRCHQLTVRLSDTRPHMKSNVKYLSRGHNDEMPDLSIAPLTFRLLAGCLPAEKCPAYLFEQN